MRSASIRVGVRLGMSFGALLVIAVLMAAVGSSRLSELVGLVQQTTEVDARKERLAREWRTGVEVNAARAYAILSATDPKALNEVLKPTMAETSKAISERQKELETLVQSPEGKAILAKVAAARSAYTKSREQSLAAAGTPDSARIFKDETVPRMSAYLAAVAELTDWQHQVINASGLRAAQTAQRGSSLMIALAVAALVLGGALSWLIARGITRPLAEAVAVANTVAAGDLTRELRATRGDEIGQLQRALQAMTASLREVIGAVNGSVRQIATASDEIARGNQDLSTRTEQQAGSLQQTASAMEQLAGAIEANARSAQDASRLAAESAALAARGGEVVGEVMSTMAGISQASGEIGQIIAVIDGIAFQTNILALNAAVEAARAGEQGRGFAVVAGEVRTLAQRSAEAARQIKSLIETSAARVDDGTRLVRQAGSTMDEVTASVQRVTALIGEISGALGEQSSGIGQVNLAVNQLDQVTQQNAALVEQAAAAAESTKQQAGGLAQAVSVFRL